MNSPLSRDVRLNQMTEEQRALHFDCCRAIAAGLTTVAEVNSQVLDMESLRRFVAGLRRALVAADALKGARRPRGRARLQ